MNGINILIVEDEEKIRRLVAKYLKNEGYKVFEAENGKDALDIFNMQVVDLIIMDVMMPVMDGWLALKMIRKKSNIPVIMLTARTEEEDTVFGLELGANDYVAKPFRTRELMARVKANLTRSGQVTTDEMVNLGAITIETAGMRVFVDKEAVDLTPKEYELLMYLVNNKNRALHREQILNRIWGYDFYGDDRTVDTVVKRLRKKLGEEGSKIVTIRGVGYKLEHEE